MLFWLLIWVENRPGFGNQNFEDSVYDKVTELIEYLGNVECIIPIAVDGSITIERAKKLKDLGVDCFIVGSAIFKSNEIMQNISKFKSVID